MILLDNRLADLTRGYDRITQADLRAQTEWRPQLLQTYAARRDQHASAIQQYWEKMRTLKPQLSVIVYIPLAMLLGGLVLIIVGMWMDANFRTGFAISLAGLALLSAGALGLGIPALLWLWQTKLNQPAAPAHPLHRDLLPRLMPQWRAKLREATPLARDSTRAFIEHLDALTVDSMYVLARVQLARGEFVDAVVLGARGIWVFACVDWDGRVLWRAGEWRHERFDRARRAWVHVPESSPDQVWQRMADQVAQALRARAADTLEQFPTLLPPRGGIVFTHPKTRCEIPADAPTRWGRIESWDQEIASAPIIAGLDARAIFVLLDALLDRHHEFDPTPTISMSAYATKLARQAEARLENWVAHE